MALEMLVVLGVVSAVSKAAVAVEVFFIGLAQVKEPGACMTDVLAGTGALVSCDGPTAEPARKEALAMFYERHAKVAL